MWHRPSGIRRPTASSPFIAPTVRCSRITTATFVTIDRASSEMALNSVENMREQFSPRDLDMKLNSSDVEQSSFGLHIISYI